METALGPLWRWQTGRRNTGYDKLLLAAAPWPVAFDLHLLRFPTGTHIPPHRDPTRGRHFRVNLVLVPATEGGEFVCGDVLVDLPRLKVFRSDLAEHSVTEITAGTRWVLSLGVVLR